MPDPRKSLPEAPIKPIQPFLRAQINAGLAPAQSLDNLNPPGHDLHDLGVELGRRAAWEADLLGEIVGQDIQEVAIVAFVEQRRICELDVVIASSLGAWSSGCWRLVRDGKMEV